MSTPRSRPTAEELLRDVGEAPRLTVFLASAPGAGKTRRLVEEALRAQAAGKRVAVGWLETKGRPDLERLAAPLARIPPRTVRIGEAEFADFDFEAALAAHPDLLLLDELAHSNLEGGAHAKRWQDALALRERGIGVAGALNIQHVESVAAAAESIIGHPVREIVPLSFLKAADQVIAIDVSPEQIEARLRAGSIVHLDDVDRALAGAMRPQTIRLLREMMLRTIDGLTVPVLSPNRTSTALAIVTSDGDAATFVRRAGAIAGELDLALEVTAPPTVAADAGLSRIAADNDALQVELSGFDWSKPDLRNVMAALVAVPRGPLAARLAGGPVDRDIFVVDTAPANPLTVATRSEFGPMAQAAGDLLRIGYGKLTIYLGASAGCGKTYAMLDRAHQLKADGTDVVAAFIETHGRADTQRLIEGLEVLPRKQVDGSLHQGELDFDAVLARKPQVALVDELAHTNAHGSIHGKRFDDVLSILRAGISVMTTLNVQHLEGLSDAVHRLTGQRVRETLPDAILQLADDVIFIDTTPETLRERLRAGKIYPPERVESALTNFFRSENLAALRELAVREIVHARSGTRRPSPFTRLVLGVKARERDIALIERCARLALRLEADLDVVHVARTRPAADTRVVSALEEATRRVRARFTPVADDDAARGLLREAAERNATIAVEGARVRPRWPRVGTPFARRLLDAGAPQLLILAPAGD